ncbi:hypothetical protein PPERSA_09675 [Pseudocohnilembus persalinus]|uniref:Uncharacterized protein n=1 Tax=Pseudocohnilembus persalinus TaxID=266149 RepID=A0A0V0R746_PSEPJ|nr:hypothetical protein PPERSA_09675 [Pseudocohnilembus persalinus]|eukprot:KRX10291.1 hypothetical protein PPERSA_09675 [Pseudocohnilembus persalinus]
MNQDFNFTNAQGNNQLQNSYFDLVKINSMKKNDVTLPQLSKFCDSFIQGNINSNINNNNNQKKHKQLKQPIFKLIRQHKIGLKLQWRYNKQLIIVKLKWQNLSQ